MRIDLRFIRRAIRVFGTMYRIWTDREREKERERDVEIRWMEIRSQMRRHILDIIIAILEARRDLIARHVGGQTRAYRA